MGRARRLAYPSLTRPRLFQWRLVRLIDSLRSNPRAVSCRRLAAGQPEPAAQAVEAAAEPVGPSAPAAEAAELGRIREKRRRNHEGK